MTARPICKSAANQIKTDSWEQLAEKARDWRYSDEFIGILVRRILDKETP